MKKKVMCNDNGQQQLILPHKDTEEKVFKIDFSGHMRCF